jgi:tRNA modification GTPase
MKVNVEIDCTPAEALARVTGAIGVEDILGEVFASFCIGK